MKFNQHPTAPGILVGVVVILLLTTLYGAYRLNADPLWVDEVISMQRSGHVSYVESTSPIAIWNRTALISDQVPGYYILLGIWGNLVGTSPFAMRAMSLLFGVLSVAVTFRIGTGLKGKLAGLASAMILASSAFYMLFLHEMRTYALLVFLIAVLIWCYWLVTHGKATRRAQLGLILATAGLMYSYYLSIVIIAALCLYHLIFIKKDREWWRVVILMGIAGLLFLPWLLTSFSVFDDTVRNEMRTIHTTNFITAIQNFVAAFSNKNIIFMLFLMVAATKPRQEWSRFTWFLVASTLTLMIILNQPFGVFVNLRYSLIMWIPLAILAGTGVAQLSKYGVPYTLPLIVILIGGLVSNFNSAIATEYDLPIRYLPWDSLVETLQPYQQEGDVLTFIASIEGNDWEGVHEERVIPHYFHDSPIDPMFIEDVRNLSDDSFLLDANRAAQSGDRIWLSYAPDLRSWRTGLFEERLLENNFNYCGNFVDTDELYLDLYAHPDSVSNSPSIMFSAGDTSNATLSLIQTVPETADNVLHLVHGWTLTDDFPRHQYSLAVHILDSTGTQITQADYGIPAETFDCVQATVDLSELVAGSYQIGVFAYNWQDNTRLESLTIDEKSDYIVIGEFTVSEVESLFSENGILNTITDNLFH